MSNSPESSVPKPIYDFSFLIESPEGQDFLTYPGSLASLIDSLWNAHFKEIVELDHVRLELDHSVEDTVVILTWNVDLGAEMRDHIRSLFTELPQEETMITSELTTMPDFTAGPNDWVECVAAFEVPFACAKWMVQYWRKNDIDRNLENVLEDNYPGKTKHVFMSTDGPWYGLDIPTALVELKLTAQATGDTGLAVLEALEKLAQTLITHPELEPIAALHDNREGLEEGQSRLDTIRLCFR